jgi:LPS sulfotransferase NodH
MSERELDEPRFDQPVATDDGRRRTYVVCTTPRSGSWLLCRQLVNAGIGVPSEYFGIDHLNALSARWNVDPRDARAYLRALKAHRTTRNGVFGTKLLWTQFADRRTALKIELLRNAHIVYLHRSDLVPQVVSLHLSVVTGHWGSDVTPSSNRRDDIPIGDATHLAQCERMLVDEQKAWTDVLASLQARRLTIAYEDLVADQPGTVQRVAAYLGLDEREYRLPPAEARETPFSDEVEAQRRELVARWRARGGARATG